MYSQRITRDNKAAIIFLVDCSLSMAQRVDYKLEVRSKSELVSYVINSSIMELILRCKSYDGFCDYFDIAVLGYGEKGITGLLDGKNDFVSAQKIYNLDAIQREMLTARTLPNNQSIYLKEIVTWWVNPSASGSTPMGKAFSRAYTIANKWSEAHPNSFPVIVFNITDGECSDCSDQTLKKKAEALKQCHTNDGNLLLFNIHISSYNDTAGKKIIFPSSLEELLEVKSAKLLYELSSEMPSCYNEFIAEFKPEQASCTYRAMSFNTSINDLFSMINIGSITLSSR